MNLITHDATGHAYDAPHWLDFDRDGQITAPPQSPPGATGVDRRFPIAYTRNTPMTIAAFEPFFSKDAFGNIPTTFTITGTGSDGSIYTSAPTIPYAPFTGSPLPDHIAYLPNYTISWKISFEEGQDKYLWFPLGTTTHEVYVTLRNPLQSNPAGGSPLLHTTIHLGCTLAGSLNETTMPLIYDAIWAGFADRHVRRRDQSTRPLTYYEDWNTSSITVAQLLATQDGQCGSWARLFLETLLAQGIREESNLTMIWHENLDNDFGFIVPNWSFTGSGTSGIASYPWLCLPLPTWGQGSYNSLWSEVTDMPGIAGQGQPRPASMNPASFFNNHIVCSVNNRIYDPSYGTSYWTLDDVEGNIAGYWTFIEDFPVSEATINADLNNNGDITDIFVLPVFLFNSNPPGNQILPIPFTH